MRNPLSRKIVEIQPSGIRKFFDVANEMEDAISLGVGEPDFDTPWRIREEGMFKEARDFTNKKKKYVAASGKDQFMMYVLVIILRERSM